MWIALTILALFLPVTGRAELCTPDLEPDDECSIYLRSLRPTQFAIGAVDVKEKRAEVLEGGTEFLKDNRAEVVIGPKGKYYLIDKHHTMRAAHDEGFPKVHARIVDNLSSLSEENFVNEMIKRKWVRLIDHSGATRAFSDLPRHVKDLKNDRYRSLAWLVRQSGAFKKSPIPFAEFDWADYFRGRITIGPGPEGWDAAVKEGIRLATILKTEHLPGHAQVKPRRRSSVRAACWEHYAELAKSLIR